MKKSILFILLVLSIASGLISSCGKKASDPNLTSSASSTIEPRPQIEPVPNHDVKKVELGIADSFAILAYTSITSTPRSNITGKIGLKPGGRSLIIINPSTEVEGGMEEIYASDDVGDPLDYLNLAREDLIETYRDLASRNPDKDKLEAYEGLPGGQILPAGIYRWSNGVKINSDITLSGDENDVFIFQIIGDMLVAPKVKIKLSNGARMRNVFWQVSARVTLEAQAVVTGTIISQLTFEMKELAELNGRAFVKNGKLLLSKNTITKPGF